MNRLLAIIALLVTPPVLGDDVYVHRGETSSVPINSSLGTLVEFPHPIKVVSDSAYFKIEKVATEVNKKGEAINIRIVKVRPRRGGNITETVPFVLAGRRSLTLRFIATGGAPKHQRIRFPTKAPPIISSGAFLDTELKLMRQMLKDESGEGFQRAVMKKELSIEGYDDKLDMVLVRRFEGQGLFGYTFKLVNTTESPLTINPQALNFGSPNRAALLQVDHETLEPCSVNASTNPRSNSCVTALRLVVRGDHFITPSSGSELPFRIGKRG